MKTCKRYYFASWASLALMVFACERADSPAAQGRQSNIVPKPHAQENEEHGDCTNATLNGPYGLYRSGTRNGVPVAAIGLGAFDGTGAVASARQTARRGGVTVGDIFTTPAAQGPYEVHPDCTGRFLNPDGSVLADIVVVDGGKEIYFTSRAAGVTAVGVQRPIDERGCTNASLKGAYGSYRSGTSGTDPVVGVDFATFDGTGAVATARQTVRRNGVTDADLFTTPATQGPYEVDPDCAGKLFNADGSVLAHLVVVDGGKELFFISLAPGVTSTGIMKRINDHREDDED